MAVLATWGDFEAMSYFYTGAGYDPFSGLHCPILMSRTETIPVAATFDNNTDQPIQPYYEAEISGVSTTRKLEDQLTVAPHGAQTVQWPVSGSDIDLGSFVMVKLDILPVAGYATREATCGIVALNLLGLTGGQAFGLLLALSLLGMVAGLALRESSEEPAAGRAMNVRAGLRAAGAIGAFAMLAAFVGWWVLGIIFSAIAVLLLLVLLRLSVTGEMSRT